MDSRARILIIDDEDGIRKGCARVLGPLGYQVDLATGFGRGLEMIRQETYDLVLLDVMMPDGRGIDLLEPIRERDPETVAVLITGYATVELAVEAIKRGAYDFISKPFSAQLLTMTVEQGLQKRRLSLEARRLQAVELQVADLKQAREQAEKLSEFKSSFATLVAHELRSPVAAVQTLVRTLLRGLAGDLNPKQTEVLGRVDTRLSGLLALVNDLLTLAASKSIEADAPLQAVQLGPVVERVLGHWADDASGKNISLTRSLPAGDLVVTASEDGLETILSNLVCNAIKYTPSGGSVRVELEDAGASAVVRVTDTGIGIGAEDLPRIGEEFFRGGNAKASGAQGTGLGLSIVKELLQRFGARMDIQSQPEHGTAITLHFVRSEDESAP